MGTRGRKSRAESMIAEAAVAAPINGLRTRQEPPPGLPAGQVRIWQDTVGSRPADWFGSEHRVMLEAYCFHADFALQLKRQLDVVKPEKLKTKQDKDAVAKLRRQLAAEEKMVNAYARAMRLTQQSIYHTQVAGGKVRRHNAAAAGNGAARPWEH